MIDFFIRTLWAWKFKKICFFVIIKELWGADGPHGIPRN